MESLLILAAVLFIGLPLPICIFLLVKRSTDATRIQVLESKLAQLSNKPSQPPPGKIPETVAPPPTPVSAATEPVEPPQPIETTSEPATPPIAALNAPAEYNSISQEPFAENVVSKPEPISPPPPPKPSGFPSFHSPYTFPKGRLLGCVSSSCSSPISPSSVPDSSSLIDEPNSERVSSRLA